MSIFCKDIPEYLYEALELLITKIKAKESEQEIQRQLGKLELCYDRYKRVLKGEELMSSANYKCQKS